jgi:hypothetical protein
MSCAGTNYVVPGADPCAQDSGGVQTITGGNGILVTGTPTVPIVSSKPVICQFTKLSNQLQTAVGPTIVSFNALAGWIDPNSQNYIWYVSGSTTRFQVNTAGVYQFEFALLVNGNGASWNTQRQPQVYMIRGTSSALLQQSIFVPSGNGYAAQVTGTLSVQVGDFLECHLIGNNTSGLTQIQGFDGVFDYNTTFTYTYIRP